MDHGQVVTLGVSVRVRPGMHTWTGHPGISLNQIRLPAHGDTAVLDDPLDQEMTTDPLAATATKAAPV
jgi:hypothetical protein